MMRMKCLLGVVAIAAGGLGTFAWAGPRGDFLPVTCNTRLIEISPTPLTFLCADGFIGPFGQGPVGSYFADDTNVIGGVLEAGFDSQGDLNPGGQVPGDFSAFNSRIRADASNPNLFNFSAGAGVSIPGDAQSPVQGGAGNLGAIPLIILDPTLPVGATIQVDFDGLLEGSLSHLTTGNGRVTMSARVIVSDPTRPTPIFTRNWFAESSNTSQFEQGFDSGEFTFGPGTGTANATFNDGFEVLNGDSLVLEGAIFADGFESGDTSSWSNTLSFNVRPSSANPNVTFTIVPEPASLSLLMVGGLIMCRRRRRNGVRNERH